MIGGIAGQRHLFGSQSALGQARDPHLPVEADLNAGRGRVGPVSRYLRAIVATCLLLGAAGAVSPALVAALSPGASAPAYELTNWDGKRISSDSLRGSHTIVAFTYAKCIRACPMLTYQLKGLDRRLGHPADVKYVHISVNPSADTAEEILEHFRKHEIDPRTDRRWLFLAGDEKEVEAVLSDYDIDVTLTPVDGGHVIDHSIKVFVMSPDGKLAAEFDTYHWDENRMRHALGAAPRQQ